MPHYQVYHDDRRNNFLQISHNNRSLHHNYTSGTLERDTPIYHKYFFSFFLIDTCIYVCGYKSTPTCILIMALGQVRIFIICWDMRPGFCGCILTIANIIISDIFMTIKEYYWHLNYTRSPQTYLKTWHHNNKVVPILRIYLV